MEGRENFTVCKSVFSPQPDSSVPAHSWAHHQRLPAAAGSDTNLQEAVQHILSTPQPSPPPTGTNQNLLSIQVPTLEPTQCSYREVQKLKNIQCHTLPLAGLSRPHSHGDPALSLLPNTVSTLNSGSCCPCKDNSWPHAAILQPHLIFVSLDDHLRYKMYPRGQQMSHAGRISVPTTALHFYCD